MSARSTAATTIRAARRRRVRLLGAALPAATDRRPLWVLGAVFQVLVIVMDLVVAEKRTPAFEARGLGLKVAQLAILAALVYLSVTPAQAQVRTRGARPGAPTVAWP